MSQQKEIGTLVVVVLKAQHLHQPSFYKQNPYSEVSLSGLKKRTKVDLKGGQHPVWDDEFRFPVLADAGKDKVNRVLEVSCYKEEQRGEDVLLGKGTVDIEGTLKTGEFDDWIPLVTSAGARGEVYLEMTFYANSPPPLTRRPSKLNPSDRPARPAAYFPQSRQSNPPSASPSPQRERSSAERKPRQSPADVNQIPSSLIPAHGPKSQPSRQPPSNGGAVSTIAVKHKDSLPPLPANDSYEVAPGKNPGVPAALHPGGRSGRRPMPPLGRTRMTSMGQPPPELLPDLLHRRAASDIPALTPFSQLQAPLQTCSPEMSSTTGPGTHPTPPIIVEEHVEEHPRLAFPTPVAPSLGAIQEREPRGYTAGSYSSPGQVYMQGHAPEGYSQTFSPAQHLMPSQSPQQPYDMSPPMTSPSPRPQQYSASSGGAPAPQPLSPPQVYPHLRSSNQPQQQQTPYPPQLQQYSPFQQQSFVPLQKQQYLPPPQQQVYYPQHLPYTQTPHIPNVPQRCQENTIASPPQPPLYSQIPQQHLAAPLPPPVQSQTPQSYTSHPTHQPQSYFSPPPPPPPLPPPQFNNQGEGASSTAVFVAVPSQAPVLPPAPNRGQSPPSTSLGQSAVPAAKSPTTTPSPSSVVNAPTFSAEEAFRERPVEEGKNDAKPVAIMEAETEMEDKVRSSLQCTPGNVDEDQNKQRQLDQPEDVVQASREEKENRRQIEDANRQCDNEESQEKGELKRREEDQRREEEHRIWVEEERRRQEEYRRREDEEQRKQEEEKRKEREEIEQRNEERRIREEEERRKRDDDEQKKREEDRRRREEEECRIREDERRKRDEDERKKREEERRKQEEEERRRREEGERRRREKEEAKRRREEARRGAEAEAEKRWQEELAHIQVRAEQEAADAAFARAQMEAEEAERRRQEEADLVLLRQAQEEAEREEKLAQERRRQEEADMEVARREQAHEEELERRRQKERKQRMEEADRELARKLDMELNLDTEHSRDRSQQRGAPSSGRR